MPYHDYDSPMPCCSNRFFGRLSHEYHLSLIHILFWKKATKASVWASFVVGVGITVANFFLEFTTPIAGGALAIVSSFFVVPLVSLITPRPNKEYVAEIFTCYDETVAVTHRFALKEDNEDEA